MMSAVDIVSYTGPLLITVGIVTLYYAFQINILLTKRRLTKAYRDRGEKFDRYFGEDREMLAADRLQLNLLEHMPPFLVLLWLVALFVGPGWASAGGGVYLLTRLAYPFMIGKRLGRGVRDSILFVTGPGYLVLLYFCVVLVVQVIRVNLAWGLAP